MESACRYVCEDRDLAIEEARANAAGGNSSTDSLGNESQETAVIADDDDMMGVGGVDSDRAPIVANMVAEPRTANTTNRPFF